MLNLYGSDISTLFWHFCFFKLSDVVFVMLINVKMPTIDGILIFMSMTNFMLSLVVC